MRRFADLAKADFFMDGNLTSNPGEWIRTSGEQAVRDAFGALTSNAAAQKTVKKLKDDITAVNGKIKARKNAIRHQRRSQQAKIDDAKNKVNALQGDINNESSTINSLRSQANRSCNQTKRICTWYDIFKRECTSHATVADVPARAACNWNRGKAAVQLVGAEAAKAALVASKTIADKTLAALERGISKIPVDLDPVVTSLLAKRDALKLSLVTAQQTLLEFTEAGDFLTKGLNVLGDTSGRFAIKAARVQGDLRAALDGKPVVLTLDYVLDGHDYRDRLAYSMKSPAINVAQMKAWVMGIAVHAMTDFARSQPLVPYDFLQSAVSKFEKVEAAAHAEQEKAFANLHEPGKPSGHYATIEEAVASGQETLSASQRNSQSGNLDAEQKKLDAARRAREAQLVATSGELAQYTLDSNGMFGALPKGIGNGWGGLKEVFAGADNRVFAVDQSGNFHVYFFNSNGTYRYTKVTGNGWGGFTHVLNGPPGYVYAITTDGKLLAYHLNGKGGFVGGERQVGWGWGGCEQLFSDARNNLYCIHSNGDLWDYQMESNAAIGGAEKIGSGWTANAAHVFAIAGGIVYLIDNQGRLWYYRHAQGGNWPVTHKLAGSGWGPFAHVFSNGRNVFAIRR